MGAKNAGEKTILGLRSESNPVDEEREWELKDIFTLINCDVLRRAIASDLRMKRIGCCRAPIS